MIARGIRDLLAAFLGVSAFTAAASLLVGLAAGLPALRSVSGGFLLVGSLLFTAGAVTGLRDPARARERGRRGTSGGPATWTEAFHLSAALVGLGLTLVVVGIALDPRYSL